MQTVRQISLFITIILWAIIIGGVAYSHIVYFPAYLSHLPESNQLITGRYGLHDENFWMRIHPLVIVFTIATLILNWRMHERRKFILIPFCIYAAAILATAIYFVPGLKDFAGSHNSSNISPSEWYQRGQDWQHLSWIRGFSLFLGFILLLIAVTKSNRQLAMDNRQ